VTELLAGGLSASSVQRTHGLLSQMLDLAVRDRRLPANPAKGVKLPRKLPKVRRFLTADQVEALVVECEPYGQVVRFLAYTGLRWGERAALRVRDVDPLRRRMHIARSVTEDNGRLIRTFARAAKAISEPQLTPHGLRHTAASLAIAAGANVKVVQQMLGHATASMTSTSTGTCSQTNSTTSPTVWTSSAERLRNFLRTFCGLKALRPCEDEGCGR
jgi:integrase